MLGDVLDGCILEVDGRHRGTKSTFVVSCIVGVLLRVSVGGFECAVSYYLQFAALRFCVWRRMLSGPRGLLGGVMGSRLEEVLQL